MSSASTSIGAFAFALLVMADIAAADEPCSLPGASELDQQYRQRPDKLLRSLAPQAKPAKIPTVLFVPDPQACGQGHSAFNVSHNGQCHVLARLGCGSILGDDDLLGVPETIAFSPPIDLNDGTYLTELTMQVGVGSVTISGDDNAAWAAIGSKTLLTAVTVNLGSGAVEVNEFATMIVTAAKPPAASGGSPTQQWLNCVCGWINGSDADPVLKQLTKQELMACISTYGSCLRESRQAHDDAVYRCGNQGSSIGHCMAIAGTIGSVVGGALAICVTAPVSLPAIGLGVALGAAAGGVCGIPTGMALDEGTADECVAHAGSQYLKALKDCDTDAANCLAMALDGTVEMFGPTDCGPLYPGNLQEPPIWAPPDWIDPAPPPPTYLPLPMNLPFGHNGG